jgi:hypothetical protein
MAFSFEKTKSAIRTAIQEAGTLEKSERMKRIKQLRLRWHPGLSSAVYAAPFCMACDTLLDTVINAITVHRIADFHVFILCL